MAMLFEHPASHQQSQVNLIEVRKMVDFLWTVTLQESPSISNRPFREAR
jgi:hypothetical protein